MLALFEMQTATYTVWTRVVDSISNDGYRYVKRASLGLLTQPHSFYGTANLEGQLNFNPYQSCWQSKITYSPGFTDISQGQGQDQGLKEDWEKFATDRDGDTC